MKQKQTKQTTQFENIRQATVGDLDDIWNIISAASDWLVGQGMTHWASYYTLEFVEEKIENAEVFMLENDGAVVATITVASAPPGYYSVNDEGVDHMDKFVEPTREAMYLTALAVLPKFRGKGFAKQLIAFVEDLAKERDIQYLRFDARGDYVKLVNLYKKLGYSIVGEMPDPDSSYYLFEKDLHLSHYILYILKCTDGSLYTGITNDLPRRLKAHREGKGSKYVRSRLPFELVHQEEFSTKSDALKRENFIQRMKRREKLELL
ncbi:MAG: GNAT family N-acetyltransferase [Candidatus Dojkabacteria bacterium]